MEEYRFNGDYETSSDEENRSSSLEPLLSLNVSFGMPVQDLGLYIAIYSCDFWELWFSFVSPETQMMKQSVFYVRLLGLVCCSPVPNIW